MPSQDTSAVVRISEISKTVDTDITPEFKGLSQPADETWASANAEILAIQEENLAIDEDWDKFRSQLGILLGGRHFDYIMLTIILVNFGLVWYETDLAAEEVGEEEAAKVPSWIGRTSLTFLLVYVVEILARVYVWRRRFFDDSQHMLDIVVVGMDCMCQFLVVFLKADLPSLSILRVVRIARLVLRVNFITRSREMFIMINGFIGAMRAVAYGLPVIFGIVLLWAIIAVDLLNPLNLKIAERGHYEDVECPRCPRAFVSVSAAFLTFFQQTVAADDWATISMPMIEMSPWLAGPMLTLVLVSVNLGILNLLLTTIVDSAQEMRCQNETIQLKQKESDFQKAKKMLLVMCAELDSDKSGCLTLPELVKGWDENEKFCQMLKLIDVGKEDMVTMFKVLDQDGSGSVSYLEFIEQLHKMKTQEVRTILVFVKAHIMEIQKEVTMQLDLLREDLTLRKQPSSHRPLGDSSPPPSHSKDLPARTAPIAAAPWTAPKLCSFEPASGAEIMAALTAHLDSMERRTQTHADAFLVDVIQLRALAISFVDVHSACASGRQRADRELPPSLPERTPPEEQPPVPPEMKTPFGFQSLPVLNHPDGTAEVVRVASVNALRTRDESFAIAAACTSHQPLSVGHLSL